MLDELEIHEFVVFECAWVHDEEIIDFSELGSLVGVAVDPEKQLFLEEVLVEEGAAGLHSFFGEEFLAILGGLALLGTHVR